MQVILPMVKRLKKNSQSRYCLLEFYNLCGFFKSLSDNENNYNIYLYYELFKYNKIKDIEGDLNIVKRWLLTRG